MIPGTGGLRKIRWAASGRGKRGGARIIYYYAAPRDQIWLFLICTKARKSDLTGREKAELGKWLVKWNDG